MTRQRDLFGSPITARDRRQGRRVTNDMALVERVLAVAESEGYALIGVTQKVYRREGKDTITPATSDEANTVHQLLERKWLTKGGSHVYHCGGNEGPGNSVLVPAATKAKARLWRNLAPLNGKEQTDGVTNHHRAG